MILNITFSPIRDAIERALRRVVLVLSEESIKSSWVEFEVELAFEMEKESGKTLLYPIKIDNAIETASTAWARMLRRQVHIGNFVNWANSEAYNKALMGLIEDLQVEKDSDENVP